MLSKNEFENYMVKKLTESIEDEITVVQKDFALFFNYKDFSGRISLDNGYSVYKNKISISDKKEEDSILNDIFELLFTPVLKGNAPDLFLNLKFNEVKNSIYPLLKPSDMLMTQELIISKTIYTFFTSELCLVYVVDTEQHMMYITEEHLKEWDIEKEELIKIAKDNFLRDKDIPLKIERKYPGDPQTFYVYNTHDSYDATRIILTHRIEEVASKIKGKTLIAVPNRDFLIVFSSNPSAMRRHFILQVNKDYKNMQYPLTNVVYQFNKGELERFVD